MTAEQYAQVKQALKELDDVHTSPAELRLDEPVLIVHDWQGRVYVNGGTRKPLKAQLKVGQYVEREMAVDLKTSIFYREKPPDPFFRLRIRAQAGILATQVFDAAKGVRTNFFDAGVGWDFAHIGPVNLAAHTGVFSSGAGLGLDLTKNFGAYAGYAMAYDGWRSSALVALYFSFN